MFFFPHFPPISPPWDDAQSDVAPLWHDLLLSSKSKKLEMVSVVHPGYHADKNRTAADGIIYVLVNVLGSLTSLRLYRGIHGMSNFLLQTPISFSVTLRQTGCSSLTRCGSFIFQYVCDKKKGLWRGFRAIFGKKLGKVYLVWSKTHVSTPSKQIIHPLPFLKSSRGLLVNASPEEDVSNRSWSTKWHLRKGSLLYHSQGSVGLSEGRSSPSTSDLYCSGDAEYDPGL